MGGRESYISTYSYKKTSQLTFCQNILTSFISKKGHTKKLSNIFNFFFFLNETARTTDFENWISMSAAFNTISILLAEALRFYFSKEISADYVNKCIAKKMIKFRAFSPNLQGKKTVSEF